MKQLTNHLHPAEYCEILFCIFYYLKEKIFSSCPEETSPRKSAITILHQLVPGPFDGVLSICIWLNFCDLICQMFIISACWIAIHPTCRFLGNDGSTVLEISSSLIQHRSAASARWIMRLPLPQSLNWIIRWNTRHKLANLQGHLNYVGKFQAIPILNGCKSSVVFCLVVAIWD